jgi:hypothetical protein
MQHNKDREPTLATTGATMTLRPQNNSDSLLKVAVVFEDTVWVHDILGFISLQLQNERN